MYQQENHARFTEVFKLLYILQVLILKGDKKID